jgi:hypothetical protein
MYAHVNKRTTTKRSAFDRPQGYSKCHWTVEHWTIKRKSILDTFGVPVRYSEDLTAGLSTQIWHM